MQTNRYSGTLQAPMENRIVLQMDKAAPENKIVLGYIGQRSENTNLDCDLLLCYRGNSQKKIWIKANII